MATPPQFPAGPFEAVAVLDSQLRAQFITEIEELPSALETELTAWPSAQHDTLYKNWTIRQIVHHLADSHVNCYIRFKWTLTENQPTIKAYNETDWSALEDARTGDLAAPLALLNGVHRRLVQLMRTMTEAQFARAFHHPETNKIVPLNTALQMYAWHGRHHLGQIQWLRKHRDQ